LILAGAGARWGDGPRELARFAERLQIPVVTTPKGKGVFPEGHPLSLGVFGFGGHPSATGYIEEGVDTLLAVGTGLGEVATNGFSPHLRAAKRIVHLDVDAEQMGRNWPIALGLVGDAAAVLGRMRARVGAPQPSPKFFGVRRHADPSVVGDGAEGRIQPHRALWELQRVMPPNTIYTADIGEHLLFAVQYLQVDRPDGFCAMTGLGSMGSGIGSALGIKVAEPRRPVVSVCGDGCFAMSIGDIATAAREGIDVVVFVMNDERYGMCEIGHEAVYGRRPDYSTAPMRVADVARGAGARAVVVRHTGDVLVLGEELSKPGPLVVDVQIDRSTRMPKSQRNEVLAQRPKMFN
jgi:acetolactate synthase-1/2/3 large subunit